MWVIYFTYSLKENIINIIAKALDEIKFRVPNEILKVTFKDDLQNWRHAPVSIDEQIMLKVIRPRVLIDANLVGGIQCIVSLEGLTPKYSDTYTIIFEIPAERMNFRELMSVLSIGYLPYSTSFNSLGMGMGTVNPKSMNDVLSAGQRVGDSHSNIPPISNGSCDIIGYNTVLVRDQLRVTNAYQLRCILANDDNMDNINPRSHLAFADLVELAVKAYIYNTMVIRIDQAYLTGGQELGAFKTYIESLSDANVNYQTYLNERWRPVAFMNDVQGYARYIRTMISPGL